MKWKQNQVQKYIDALEANMIDNVEIMKDLTDQDYDKMRFPLGLVIKIKQKLSQMSH